MNLCRDRARSQAGKQQRLTEPLVVPADDGTHHEREITATNTNPAEIAQANERLRSLELAIQSLPHDLKVALILVALENRPQKECAELLGITVKTVETRIYRARRLLEARLPANFG